MPVNRLLLLALCGLAAVPSPVFAQGGARDLSQVSIEDLMNIQVTSASRKEQRVSDVAAAVFVITRDDIRRSGMTTIPDVLRLAPGVDVAQINSNKWSVSVRGFNGLYANKLLVLVDGRSVYNRIFSGVFWDTTDLMLDDIDRIEVTRGPAAALWGANAVNGVINIVTRATADTQGALVRVDAGRFGEQAAARYGGTVGATRYRVFSQWTSRNEWLLEPGVGADDESHRLTAGFRADWTPTPGTLTLEGTLTSGEALALWPNLDPVTAPGQPIANVVSEARGGHLLGRFVRAHEGGSSLQIQTFIDIAGRQEPVGHYERHTFDVDTQYHTVIGARQDLVAGVGYRFIDESFNGRVGFSMTPAEEVASLFTGFVQDEIALSGSRLAVTLGSQVQYDSEFGTGVQPTARVMWKGLPHQRLWAAASRALRTPSMYERRIHVDFPPVPSAAGLPLYLSVIGNPAAETESLSDMEAGYRLEIGTASIDVTGFTGRYDHLLTQEVSAPLVRFVPSPRVLVTSQFGNQLRATTRGLEIAAHWSPVAAWRLDGSYTAFRLTPELAAESLDPLAASQDGSAPRKQWQVRSALLVGAKTTLSVALFHVGALLQTPVAAYTRADVTAEWRFAANLSVMAIGQNLLDPSHLEFASPRTFLLSTETPRSASVRLQWTFR